MGVLDFLARKKERKRVLLVGLDGVPYHLIKSLVRKGCLPNLSRLMQDGIACEMSSPILPVSSVAWTTLITGTNPAKHGIFGFVDRRRDSYGIYFPNAVQIQQPTLWDMLTAGGKKTVAVNIPQTYPAKEINGIIVSGFVAFDLDKAVYPPQLAKALQKIDYRIDVDYDRAVKNKYDFFVDLFYTLKKRREVLLYLLDRIDWDLFMGVFTGSEWLQRYCWDDYENTQSTYHQFFLKYYHEIDTIIGRLAEKIGEDTALFIVSDHGFSHVKQEVHINAWLKKEGYLRLKADKAVSVEDIDPAATQAFALDPSRVYVNLKELMPGGCVEAGKAYDDLIAKLTRGFLSLKDPATALPVVNRVFRKDELFAGPLVSRAPDLVLQAEPGYDLKGSFNCDDIFVKGTANGMYPRDDPFFYMRGAGALKTTPAIQDLAPTILKLLDIAIPDHIDGKPLV